MSSPPLCVLLWMRLGYPQKYLWVNLELISQKLNKLTLVVLCFALPAVPFSLDELDDPLNLDKKFISSDFWKQMLESAWKATLINCDASNFFMGIQLYLLMKFTNEIWRFKERKSRIFVMNISRL